MTKEDRDKELDGINQKRIKLGDLVVKLGSFIGGGEKVSEAIENAIKVLRKQLEMCQKSNNNHTSDDCQNDPNCHDITQQIQKLENFEKANKSNNNNPHDLLTNLCTGLEKFLGFNSTSKGYDGTGIVYSDLDRLCDGVMAFLSGVLESVKNENEVTTYDNYITKPNKNLNEVLDTLTTKIGSGRDGLAEAVGAVREWLEGYGEKITQYNNTITNPLSKLNSNINENKNIIAHMKNDSVGEQHNKWMAQAIKYFGHAEQAKNALDNLDPKLKNTLVTPIGKIHTAVKMIYDVAIDDNLAEQVRTVDRELVRQKIEVESKIKEKSEQLQNALQSKFNEIDGKISDIGILRDIELQKVTHSVSKLVESAGQTDNDAMNLDREYGIEIVRALGGINLVALKDETDEVADELNRVVTAVDAGLEELGSIHETVHQKANIEMATIHGELSEKIGALKASINAKLREYITGEFGKNIKDALTHFTDLIAGREESTTSGHLDKVLNGLKAYAIKVGQSFGNSVNSYLDRLLENNDVVVTSVEQYVRNTKDNWQIQGDDLDRKREAVINAIKPRISEIITASNTEIPLGNRINAQRNLQDIQKYFDGIAAAIRAGEASAIAVKIDSELKFNQSPTPGRDPKPYLQNAIHILLLQLSLVISKIAEEFKTFTGLDDRNSDYNFGEKIDEAIRDVKELGNKLVGAVCEEGNLRFLGQQIQQALNRRVDDDSQLAIEKFAQEAFKHGTKKFSESLGHHINGMSGKSGIRGIIGNELDKLYRNDINPELSGSIQAKITQLQKNINKVKDLVIIIKTNAENGIKRQTNSIRVQVNEIRLSIDRINEDIKEFDTSLREAIRRARDHITSVRRILNEEIAQLNHELTATSQRAFQIVKVAVQSMFAKQHEAELKSLSKVVEAQKADVEKIIKTDVERGLKKLLADMKKQLEEKVTNVVFHERKLKSGLEQTNSLSTKLFPFFEQVVRSVEHQFKEKLHIHSSVKSLQWVLKDLLTGLIDHSHISDAVSTRIYRLSDKVNDLQPKDLPDAGRPVLRALQHGMTEFCQQLQQQYVSRYSMQTADWNNARDGQNCAKVFMTILSTLFTKLHYLFYSCLTAWQPFTILGGKSKEENALKDFLVTCSYKIENLVKSRTGTQIAGRLHKGFSTHGEFQKEPKRNRTFDAYLGSINKTNGVISKLVGYLETYYATCHLTLPESAKYPCSIRDMMSWIGGLPYTNVYKKVPDHCHSVLNRKNEMTNKCPNKEDEVMHSVLTYRLRDSLAVTCSASLNVLVTICGNGRGFDQADYGYACEFANNARGFHYPTDVPSLFDMLTDVCRRLLCGLSFLRIRCKLTASQGNGWAGCKYGQDVVGYEWPCKDHSKSKANDQPNCQPKSPLQAQLMDQLPGCLPHRLTSVGCKSSCSTCSRNKPGQVCIAPMGFWDLSESASTCGTGKQIADAVSSLCKDAESPLCVLLHCLQSLTPSPPKTLADMIALYSQIFRTLGPADTYKRGSAQYTDNSALKSHFTGKTIVAALPLPIWLHNNFSHDRLTDALTNLYHSNNDHNTPPSENEEDTDSSSHSDLSSLTLRSNCSKSIHCGPYLQPLHFHAYHTYPQMHATVYMSWFIYTAWQLWEQLQELLAALQQISCKHFGCAKCACSAGKHGDERACKCGSVAHCGGVLPTIYKYGFMFGKTEKLVDEQKGKSCYNFCNQLDRVVRSKHFSTLFTVIDDFLFAIRTPFFYTTVALWSLSLFYLICVMVGRLDVLHIRSHLRIPSSHKITAQSLLAAAQVGRLAKISYLQP